MSPTSPTKDPFGAVSTLRTQSGAVRVYRLGKLAEDNVGAIDRLPFSIKVLLENVLRNVDGRHVTADDVVRLANWNAEAAKRSELPFRPGRVLLQDFTGVPAVVDLAALRSAMKRLISGETCC